MTDFKDFNDLIEPIILPIGGKQYTIPPVSAEDGIRFKIARSGVEGAPKITDDDFERIFLGDVRDEMIADNVPAEALNRALATALTDHSAGRDAARIMWETGGDPKAAAAYVKAHAPNRASRRSKSTGKAKRTQ